MTGPAHSWPRHVAVIMDGNGRWAEQRHLPRIEGHRAGTKSVRAVVEASRRLGISYLTLYTFSVENWKRPKKEIKELMRLLYYYLAAELPSLLRNSVRLRAAGRIDRLPLRVRRQLGRAMKKTAGQEGLTLVLALSYGGRTEILDAVTALARERREGGGPAGPVAPDDIARHLYAPDVPPPDLLVRTSGEMRLSNFLLWQCARTRLCFVPDLWPDFGEEQFARLIGEMRAERAALEGATA